MIRTGGNLENSFYPEDTMYKSKTNTCSVGDTLVDVYGAFFSGGIFLRYLDLYHEFWRTL
jgi:hypothetical protein